MDTEANRDEAILAGLLVGDCEWCGADIWADRSPDHVRAAIYAWHRDCAEQAWNLLDQALSATDKSKAP